MPGWHISIFGHHDDPDHDAPAQVADFLGRLVDGGHTVSSATVTNEGATDAVNVAVPGAPVPESDPTVPAEPAPEETPEAAPEEPAEAAPEETPTPASSEPSAAPEEPAAPEEAPEAPTP